ncbi:MAG: GntR family transcriptional regulator [Anaerolineae bacterium]|nr:GntR family transcriptional regulator [Anaerolineae bacterium]
MNADFEPVRANLGQQVFHYLRDRIYQMEYEPGTKLGVGEVADQLNVSRSPVRDAFLMLVAEGIVVPLQSGGCKVIEFDRKYINNVFTMRRALELTAVRLTAESPDQTRVEKLRQTWISLRDADDSDPSYVESHIRADNDLHQQIAEMSQNPLLQDALAKIISIAGMIRRWQYAGTSLPHHLRITCEEHLQMIEAILAGEADAAVAAMDVHLSNAHERSLARLDVANAAASAEAEAQKTNQQANNSRKRRK